MKAGAIQPKRTSAVCCRTPRAARMACAEWCVAEKRAPKPSTAWRRSSVFADPSKSTVTRALGAAGEGAAVESALGRDGGEHISAHAALHAEEGGGGGARLVPEDHRRERAVELDADAVTPEQLARERVDALGLLESQLLVEG